MTGRAPDAWTDQAACLTHPDPDLWFPDAGRARSNAADVLAAKAICGTCPVAQACLDAAFVEERGGGRELVHGIRGGHTAAERLRLHKKAAAAERAATVTVPRRMPDRSPQAVAARENAVRAGWRRGLTDREIAAQVGVTAVSVCLIRRRLGLAAHRTIRAAS